MATKRKRVWRKAKIPGKPGLYRKWQEYADGHGTRTAESFIWRSSWRNIVREIHLGPADLLGEELAGVMARSCIHKKEQGLDYDAVKADLETMRATVADLIWQEKLLGKAENPFAHIGPLSRIPAEDQERWRNRTLELLKLGEELHDLHETEQSGGKA